MAKTHRLEISRFGGESETTMECWKDLASALVMNGYEVSGNTDSISFNIGWDDNLTEVEV